MIEAFSLVNKTILITGASSGIGKQCAIDCSKMGAKVILIARNEERLKETLSRMEGNCHSYFSFDLYNVESIKNLVLEIVNKCGRINGFIHAAGVELTKPLKLLNPNDFEQIYKINTISGFEFVRQFCDLKYFNKEGSIVFISSITAIIGRGGVAAYAATKGAMVSTARVLAIELAKKRIRVNCISPGTILTPLMQNYLSTLSEEEYKKRISGFPLGLGESSDISYACIYLLGDTSRWITGQNLVVDGGYTIC